MSFKEMKKRTSFLRSVENHNVKARLYDCINASHFWKLVKDLNLIV